MFARNVLIQKRNAVPYPKAISAGLNSERISSGSVKVTKILTNITIFAGVKLLNVINIIRLQSGNSSDDSENTLIA